MTAGSGRYAYRKGFVALDEAGIDSLRLADYLDPVEPLQHLLPDDLQLQFRKPHADAAVDAEAEREMIAGARPVDDELPGTIDHFLVAVARDVPHHHAVALFNLLAADFSVLQGRAAHMRKRRLPADHLGHHGVDQIRVFAQLLVLVRVLVQRQHRAGHGVAGRVVAADDEQDEVATTRPATPRSEEHTSEL